MARSALVASLIHFVLAGAVAAQQTGTVSGHIIDGESLKPIRDAIVLIRGLDFRSLTDVNGVFRLTGIPSGTRVIVVQHIAYGEHADTVVVGSDRDLRLEVRISRQAIQLSPLLVQAQTALEARRRSTGHAFNEIAREQIDAAAQKGQNLAELLRDGLIGVRVSGERRGAVCVEYRQGGMGLGAPGVRAACREVAVFMDGVRISAPATIYATIPLRDIERIEVQGPYEAGTRYGIAGGNGVLLIETRQGPAATRRPEQLSTLMTGLDWSLESQPYRWPRVLAGSFLGNAAGLGVGLLVADQCFKLDAGIHGLRSKCDALSTVLAGFVILGVPGVSSSFAARWGGATDRSEGRVVPAALLGTLTAGAGYFLLLQANSNDSKSLETAGTLVLTVGTPLVTGVADRVFRRLRQ
jgi:hypothetical protein